MSKKDKIDKAEFEEEVDLNETEIIEPEESQEKVDDALNELQEAIKVEKDRYLRLFAEFENYKKRTIRERVEMFKTAGEDVVQALLPVLDDFGRALAELEKSSDENLFKGVELINTKLREILKSKGLEQIEVNQGDSFNADTHEAVSQIASPDEKLKGKIIDVVEMGYRMGDKVIRYPKVVIGQ